MTQPLWCELERNTVYRSLLDCGLVRRENRVSLRGLTTFRTGGTADLVLYPQNEEACSSLLQALEGFPFVILGNGSNVLAPDEGLRTPLIAMKDMNRIEQRDPTKIYAQAGVSVTKLAVELQRMSLTGAEFLYGIPGSVGGAAIMNAGAYDHALEEIVDSVTVCSSEGALRQISKEEARFSYRHSRFMETGEVVLGVTFRLRAGNKDGIWQTMNALMDRRRSKQPLEYPSAGSYFKRPPGHFAGKLIEDCSLKGVRVGGAMVSEKHAGFLINYENATTDDVLSLEELVKKTVWERYGIELECEVRKLTDPQ